MTSTASATAVGDKQPNTVRKFLEQMLKSETISHRTADYVIVEFDDGARISAGAWFLLNLALNERIQHGTGGTPAEDALLIINTIRSEGLG